MGRSAGEERRGWATGEGGCGGGADAGEGGGNTQYVKERDVKERDAGEPGDSVEGGGHKEKRGRRTLSAVKKHRQCEGDKEAYVGVVDCDWKEGWRRGRTSGAIPNPAHPRFGWPEDRA